MTLRAQWRASPATHLLRSGVIAKAWRITQERLRGMVSARTERALARTRKAARAGDTLKDDLVAMRRKRDAAYAKRNTCAKGSKGWQVWHSTWKGLQRSVQKLTAEYRKRRVAAVRITDV
jgi:hypothetical protein